MKPMILILSLCLGFVEPVISSPAQAKEDKRVEQLENENKKLARTKDPANRAKSLMKIADITLSYITEDANANDFTKMKLHVEQYQQAVTNARDTMLQSGLDPHKKPGGYKAVEIALRKQIRTLQDIGRLLTVDERVPVDEALNVVVKIREEFIHALFG